MALRCCGRLVSSVGLSKNILSKWQPATSTFIKCKSTAIKADVMQNPLVSSAMPSSHQSIKVCFDNHKTADFKNIWLRDNCKCSQCISPETRQKLVDTPSLDVNTKPKSFYVNEKGQLIVTWMENEDEHISTFDSSWLYKYGQSFMHETFESESHDTHPNRPPIILWDRTSIWKQFPEISYNEVMDSDEGLKTWLEMVHKYGIAVMRNVPPKQGKIVEVVKRFAYVKETQYGVTFDVINEPDPTAHLAYSGLYLHHHTDMNYREKTPGMQLLHCLKANNPKEQGEDPGGMSFFVDGFRAAKWLEDNEPAAFHILTSTPIRFQIKNQGNRYSQLWPIICLNSEGDITEIHYNNRTMGPVQSPSHVVVPFYHAYKLLSKKMRDPSSELKFHMLPGDLVAFNNRRVLHGRTGFDPSKVVRHLEGCYVDIDEAMSKYDSLLGHKSA
ncbi:gamma-butyrobetaine dioxygenase-like [Ischnura elegans]|uniref:gamma-butyrobetaine dioxygenase-like n=1 Tax=Ischnura elegans TaxID=197161 RepID=UPI001ED8A3C6|nr:gamma-butyrobetaine dioxygenase-like [Ischnura elegans]